MSSKIYSLVSIIILSCASLVGAQSISEVLFANPPKEAKPKTWMHAMSGNMSKEGLTKDLEAIQKVGIGGVLLFNVTHAIPKGKIKYNSEEHHQMLTHAAQECERLGLSFGVHNCDGWTSSGGPWITPENAMKMLVWRETIVEGGKKTTLTLPKPTARMDFYKDVAVVAYPSLAAELEDAAQKPIITSSDKNFDAKLASDGKWDVVTNLKSSAKKRAWVQFDFEKTVSIRSVSMSFYKAIAGSKKAILLKSDDGVTFVEAAVFNAKRMGKREYTIDENFAPITARYFRLEPEDSYEIMEMSLNSRPNYDEMVARTSLFKIEDNKLKSLQKADNALIIDKKTVLDLTQSMDSEGKLTVELPKGNWTIMRFGYSTTAAVNSPSSDEGRGLEVDKMSKVAFKIHYDAFVGKVISNSKKVAPNALQYLEIDSYEVGGQNWTAGYETLFKTTFGHDLIPFLPIYAGRIVENTKTTDDVLWEIRKLNSDLITENYFGYFAELTKKDGLISYIEPYSFNAPFNELDAGKHATIPMGEFWMHRRFQTGTAVSSARIYGKNVISAESFSAQSEINWKGHPALSKLTGDMAWALGINEFMFHRFAHQANTHVKPGMTMSQWGSHIDRTQTWWENAGAEWFKYIARGSYLLRGGIPVSDLLVFVGEGSPNSVTNRNDFSPKIPFDINYDNVNADVLNNRIRATNGRLVLPEGTSYKALVLDNSDKITLKTLKSMHELSNQGIVIIGKKPTQLAGYNPSPENLTLFNTLIEEIWQKKTTYADFNWQKIFKENNWQFDLKIDRKKDASYIHRVTANEDIYFLMNEDSTAQTVNCTFNQKGKIPERWNAMTGKVEKLAQFQETAEGTIIPLQLQAEESAFIIFRKKTTEVNQVVESTTTNKEKPVFYFKENNKINALIAANGSYTTTLADKQKWEIIVSDLPKPFAIENPWTLSFDKASGYDAKMEVKDLFDWKNSPVFDLKHYSGTATYSNTFVLSEEQLKSNNQLILDLGKVSIAAKITLNGKELGVLWMPPFTIDITNSVKKGQNELVIELTNTWTNRLIGDEHYPRTDGYVLKNAEATPSVMPEWYTQNQPIPEGKRQTFSAFPFYKATDELQSSGLIGPVVIKTNRIIEKK
jgi:alpha-L-rhamnosidase/F5/8 type C domain